MFESATAPAGHKLDDGISNSTSSTSSGGSSHSSSSSSSSDSDSVSSLSRIYLLPVKRAQCNILHDYLQINKSPNKPVDETATQEIVKQLQMSDETLVKRTLTNADVLLQHTKVGDMKTFRQLLIQLTSHCYKNAINPLRGKRCNFLHNYTQINNDPDNPVDEAAAQENAEQLQTSNETIVTRPMTNADVLLQQTKPGDMKAFRGLLIQLVSNCYKNLTNPLGRRKVMDHALSTKELQTASKDEEANDKYLQSEKGENEKEKDQWKQASDDKENSMASSGEEPDVNTKTDATQMEDYDMLPEAAEIWITDSNKIRSHSKGTDAKKLKSATEPTGDKLEHHISKNKSGSSNSSSSSSSSDSNSNIRQTYWWLPITKVQCKVLQDYLLINKRHNSPVNDTAATKELVRQLQMSNNPKVKRTLTNADVLLQQTNPGDMDTFRHLLIQLVSECYYNSLKKARGERIADETLSRQELPNVFKDGGNSKTPGQEKDGKNANQKDQWIQGLKHGVHYSVDEEEPMILSGEGANTQGETNPMELNPTLEEVMGKVYTVQYKSAISDAQNIRGQSKDEKKIQSV